MYDTYCRQMSCCFNCRIDYFKSAACVYIHVYTYICIYTPYATDSLIDRLNYYVLQ